MVLRRFKKQRLQPKAIRPYRIIELFPKSAMLEPMTQVGQVMRRKRYNLKDIAPFKAEEEWLAEGEANTQDIERRI